MEGRPTDWEVAEVDGDRLRIGNRWICTTLLEDHVVAWTELDQTENDA
jgi:hypothetical protein